MYAKKTIKNTIYNSSKLPKTKPKEKQQSHKNNSKVFDEMIIKGYKLLRQWLSDMESEFSVSRKKTSAIFPLLYVLSHPRNTNFFSFSSCVNPSTHVLTENNATLWKKKLGENMKRFSETSTRLPIKHFRKKLVQKILNGFGHTDVREIMLSKKFVCILIELRVHKRNEHQVWLFTVSWSFGDNKILPAEELILTKNKKLRDQINFRNQTCSN